MIVLLFDHFTIYNSNIHIVIGTHVLSLLFSDIFLDMAMTGEITLRGVVLPVGGIKEKVIAAYRNGIKKVILPQRNSKDLKDVPDHVKVSNNINASPMIV